MPASHDAQSATAAPDLSVDLAGLNLANPVMTASGTSGYGPEYSPYLPIDSLGAFVTKAVSPEPRKGNPPPRTFETPGGMLNAIGLANVGLQSFINDKIPYLDNLGIPVIVNVVGHSHDDYLAVCEALDQQPAIDALELNVSCPNVADGLEFGTDPRRLNELLSTIRPRVKRAKLIVKLSPNVTSITDMARAAVDAGVDAISAINTLRGMAIHVDQRRPMLGNNYGGLSGPAVKPVALFMVHQVYQQVTRDAGVPIIGMGGINNWRDTVEFILAGASAVAIGTALFADPTTSQQICKGLSDYLVKHEMTALSELIGRLELN
ncbi:MAG: dihydroorotate dehydrogenase [Phycisphaerae bacterium]